MGAGHFRAHQRFVVDIDANLRATGRPALARGRVIDLGVGGAACELDAPLRMGEEVEIELSSAPPLRLRAVVAWIAWAESSSVRIGVRFRPEDVDAVASVLEFLGVQDDVGSE